MFEKNDIDKEKFSNGLINLDLIPEEEMQSFIACLKKNIVNYYKEVEDKSNPP